MRKSISKLIVAGLSMVLCASASAAPQTLMKMSKATNLHNISATATIPSATGKQSPVKFVPTRAEKSFSHHVPTAHKLARPDAKKLPGGILQLPAASDDLYGISIYPAEGIGVYTMSTDASSNAINLVDEDWMWEDGNSACIGRGVYYVNCMYSFFGYIRSAYHVTVDLETWEVIDYVDEDLESDKLIEHFATDITYDYTTDQIYGCYYTDNYDSGYMLAIQDPETYETKEVGPLAEGLNSIAASKDGKLYGIDFYGILYEIDKETAEMSFISWTGYEPAYTSSATIDPMTNVMYWSLAPDDDCGYLIALDVTTGDAQMLYRYEDDNEFIGLGIPKPSVDAAAPAAPKNLEATFEGDLRVGKVSFVMPNATFGGTPIMAPMNWTVERNGEVINSGEAYAGAAVSFVEVVPATGLYTYRVYVENKDGVSPKVKTTLWVGPETPVSPQNVEIAVVEDGLAVAWDAIDAPEYAGDVTYRVRLYKDDIMIGFQEVDGTSCTFAIPEAEILTSYYATVEAVTLQATSDLGVSTSIALGHATTPYIDDFTNPASLAGYTILDENGDGFTWSWDQELMKIRWNSSMAMDDWLITPPIRLEAGNVYKFAIAVAGSSEYYPERVEVCLGTAPTAAAMNSVVIDPTEITSNEVESLTASVMVEETGDYYFGVHGCSDADEYYLYLHSISVSAGMDANAPAAPVVRAEAASGGALSATISYTVPSKNLAGQNTTVAGVKIACDGVEVENNTNVTAGHRYSTVVEVPENGTYTFSVTAYNEYGDGDTGYASAYIGISLPETPENIVMIETATPGEVCLTWDPVLYDINGTSLSASDVAYFVVTEDGDQILAEGTTVTYQAVEEGQSFTYANVYAETVAGFSQPGYSNFIPVGEPYEMPMIESFEDGGLSYNMGAEGSADWILCTDEDGLIDGDFDGTNGYVAMQGSYVGDEGTLMTGKINIDAEAPYISLAHFVLGNDDANTLDIVVTDCATGEAKVVKSVALNEGTPGTWVPVLVPIPEYIGKDVYVKFIGTVNYYAYIIFDQIKVYQPADYDLSALNIVAPAVVAPGEEFNVDVTVMNLGAKDVAAYAVELIHNGDVVAKVDVAEALAAGQTTTVSIAQTLTPLDKVSNYYSAKVACEGDADPSNDHSAETSVLLDIPNYPTASELSAQQVDGGISLTWAAPDLSPENMPLKSTIEDFEGWTAFSQEGENGFTLVDVDQVPVGGAQGLDVPGIVIDESTLAYYVMNPVEIGLNTNSSFDAHSGVQYLVSTYSDFGANSDWMITPELNGSAQLISFWAKSYSSSWTESITVHYSTTDNDPESFEAIDTYYDLPAEWTEYTVAVPEGTKYFAIECISDCEFMLFIDDVKFIAADSEPESYTLVGYNIYRNGVKINEAPVTETSYIDAEGTATDVYVVTVVYEEGESAASNFASVMVNDTEVSGINSAVVNAKISVEGRTIVVAGAQGRVNIYAADGKLLYNAAAGVRNTLSVTPGVYVVKTGNGVQKVQVK